MRATAATLVPSRNPASKGDLRIRAMSGRVAATSTKPGKKIPNVASAAPFAPNSRYPMNVAVVKTGPGVSCPTATASRSCASVIQ